MNEKITGKPYGLAPVDKCTEPKKASRCPDCDKPFAACRDFLEVKSFGERGHLCWREYTNDFCTSNRVDWRSRCLQAESEVERLKVVVGFMTTEISRIRQRAGATEDFCEIVDRVEDEFGVNEKIELDVNKKTLDCGDSFWDNAPGRVDFSKCSHFAYETHTVRDSNGKFYKTCRDCWNKKLSEILQRCEEGAVVSMSGLSMQETIDLAILELGLEEDVGFGEMVKSRTQVYENRRGGQIDVDGADFKWHDGATWRTAGTAVGGNTLDQAYDQGGAGLGRVIAKVEDEFGVNEEEDS